MTTKFLFECLLLSSIFILEGIFPYIDRPFKEKLSHDARNIAVALCNATLSAILLASLTVLVLSWINEAELGLLHWLQWPVWLEMFLVLILFDLWMYVWHRMNHELPWLWRFHRVHHSDPFLDASSGLRFHPIEIVLSTFFRMPVYLLLGMNVYLLFAYELALQVVVLFHHSNVRLPERWDRLLRLCIVTPRMHRVHHSDLPHETNSNYSSIFSFWDRMFRSFCHKRDMAELRYGLKEFRTADYLSFWGVLYRTIVWSSKSRRSDE